MTLADFVGVPYADADCWQLTRRVLQAHGLPIPDYGYRTDVAARKASLRAGLGDWERVERPASLDVAVFRTPDGMHVGVVVARGQFLHADRESGRSRLERLTSPEWAPQLEGFYRYAR